MQPGRRRRHGTLDLRIDGLIRLQILRLCLTVQIGRNRQHADSLEHVGEGAAGIVPVEIDEIARLARYGEAFGRERDWFTADGDCGVQLARLPSLAVAHEAMPGAMGRLCKRLLIVARHGWLEAEDFDHGAGVLTEQ